MNFFHNLTFLQNKKNEGIGFTRNKILKYVLENSLNEWGMFLDSDDYLYTPYVINKILSAIEKNPNVKLIEGQVAVEDAKGFVSANKATVKSYFHGKIFSKNFIRSTNLQIPCTRTNEDVAFLFGLRAFLKKEDILSLPSIFTCLNYNSLSITRGEKSTRKFGNGNPNEMFDYYIAMLTIFNQLKENLKTPNLYNCSNFIEDFYWRAGLAEDAINISTEAQQFDYMILGLYYINIVEPILKNSSPSQKEKLKKTFSNFDFEKQGEFFKKLYNQDIFLELVSKCTTQQGYYE
jgi:glycosyltransferase involved in cell wall biosynthesis